MPTTSKPVREPRAVMTVPEAAAYWSVSAPTIRRLIYAGTLPARRIGGNWRIDVADLDALGQ